jgi:hypothetical protein
MKKLFFIALCATTLFSSCGGDKTTNKETAEAGSGLNKGEFDLSASGLPFIMQAPSDPAITSPVAGSYELKSSGEFQMQVNEGAGNFDFVKKDIQGNEVFKFKRFIAEEPEALFYEAEFQGKPSFHFFVIAKAGNNTYEFQDNKAKSFSEDETRIMFEAAKNAKAKD